MLLGACIAWDAFQQLLHECLVGLRLGGAVRPRARDRAERGPSPAWWLAGTVSLISRNLSSTAVRQSLDGIRTKGAVPGGRLGKIPKV